MEGGVEIGPTIGGVTLLGALIAGFISFLSPCVLPLVPGYLSAVSGVNPDALEAAGTRRVLVPALIFVAGFSAIFIALGLGATAVGDLLRDNRRTLETVSGILIIAMGVFFVAAMFFIALNRELRIDALMERAGKGGPLVTGAAFAVAWTPCSGPTLGAILTLAGPSGSAFQGGLLLAVYSLGLAIPFLAAAIGFSRMTRAFDLVKRYYWAVIGVGGAILVAMGVLVLTGELFRLNIEIQQFLDDNGLNFYGEI